MENHSYDHMLGFMDEPIGTLQDEKNRLCNEAKDFTYCQRPGSAF